MDLQKRTLLILLILLIFGAFLRFYGLGEQSFWLDEAITTNAAKALIETGTPTFDSGHVYNQRILNTFLIGLSMQFFGFNEMAARIPAVLFGLLTILIVYFFVKSISNEKLALMSGFFVTFVTLFIGWSRQARMYQQLQFFYLASLFLFYKYTETKKPEYLILTILSTIAAIFSHEFAYLLLIIYAFYFVIIKGIEWHKKRRLKLELKPVLIAGILLAGLFFLGLNQAIEYVLQNRVNYFWIYLNYLHNEFFVFFYLSLTGMVIALREKIKTSLMVLAFIIPFVVLSSSVLLLHFRYLFFILPLMFVFSAYSIFYFYELLKNKFDLKIAKIFGIIVFVLIVFASNAFTFVPQNEYYLDRFSPQPDFKKAYSFLEENNAQIVIDSWPAVGKHFRGKSDYWIYFNITGVKKDLLIDDSHEIYANAVALRDKKELEEFLEQDEKVWLLMDNTAWIKLSPEQKNVIQNQMVEIKEFVNDKFWIKIYST